MKLSLKSKTWLKIFLLIILSLAVLNLPPVSKEVKNLFYLISSPIQKVLWLVGDKMSDFFETIAKIKNLKKENEELSLKTQSLSAENVKISELEKENKVLREALDVGLEKDFKLAFAEIIGKDIGEDSLIINKGEKDGITPNLAVITQQKILLGQIGEIYDNFSKVVLISNKDSVFEAKIQKEEDSGAILGVVKGKGSLQAILDLIPKDREVKEGDTVITSSGGILPSGLLVGYIQKIRKSDIESFQQAEIKPAYDIKELEFVFIIK